VTVVLVALTVVAQTPLLQPPALPGVTLDGVISAAELTGAPGTLVGGGRLWLARTPEGLYVGLLPGDVGLAHICVASGDRVNVLHSSASLGTATYAVTSSGAQRLMPFAWLQPADPRAFLAAHRWTGSLPASANTAREFLLGPEWAVDGVIRLAVAYGGLGPVRRWPASVTDDCVQAGLLFGDAPQTATFRPAEWATVRVAGDR